MQKTRSQLSSMAHKVKGTQANVNFVLTDASAAMAARLKVRLERVARWWETLEDHLRHRIAQLAYEKVQFEALENLQEAVDELDAQPRVIVLPEEIEEHHQHIMVGGPFALALAFTLALALHVHSASLSFSSYLSLFLLPSFSFSVPLRNSS